MLLTPLETAALFRTSTRAIYAMAERRQSRSIPRLRTLLSRS